MSSVEEVDAVLVVSTGGKTVGIESGSSKVEEEEELVEEEAEDFNFLDFGGGAIPLTRAYCDIIRDDVAVFFPAKQSFTFAIGGAPSLNKNRALLRLTRKSCSIEIILMGPS